MLKRATALAYVGSVLLGTTLALAQASPAPSAAPAPAVAPAPAAVPAKAPDALVVLFGIGSAAIRPTDIAVLDQASRLYRDGQPIVMIVSGSTDATGSAAMNLRLSQQRADNVVQGLVARGIPVERFQILAKGATDPAVRSDATDASNRRVEITWR